jgi:tRNA dimethylallyltransferase
VVFYQGAARVEPKDCRGDPLSCIMLPEPFQNALILTGPTGSGKSQLGLELAQELGAEIVSMDSMALYRGLDIGTAKPAPADRGLVRHHLIDELDPWESASVAWWLGRAAETVRAIESRGKRVLMVGGTALYLKALLKGLFDGPPAALEVRQRLNEEAQRLGPAVLHGRLGLVDPTAAARLHPNDLRRVVRALEIYEVTARPLSDWQTQWSTPEATSPPAASPPSILWLDLPRQELYARLNARVLAMFEAGLVDEVRHLRGLPMPLSREAAQALGYKEVFAHLDGRASLEATIAQVQTRTRNFAKRQVTWFRHLPECHPASKELTRTLWKLTI